MVCGLDFPLWTRAPTTVVLVQFLISNVARPSQQQRELEANGPAYDGPQVMHHEWDDMQFVP